MIRLLPAIVGGLLAALSALLAAVQGDGITLVTVAVAAGAALVAFSGVYEPTHPMAKAAVDAAIAGLAAAAAGLQAGVGAVELGLLVAVAVLTGFGGVQLATQVPAVRARLSAGADTIHLLPAEDVDVAGYHDDRPRGWGGAPLQ